MEYQTLDTTFSMRMTDEERGRLSDLAKSESRTAGDYLRLLINREYDRLLADGHKEKEAQA